MENLQQKIQNLLKIYKSRNFLSAEKYNKELIEEHPNVVILYNILGLILTDQKKFDEAIQIYETGIRIQPDYAWIYNNLGTVYKIQLDYKKSEFYYKKSISLNKKIVESHNNLGTLYLTTNNYKDAINCFQNAISLNPLFFPAQYNLGTTFISVGKFDKAKKHLSKAIEINPHFCIGHRILSTVTKYKKNDSHLFLLKKLYTNPQINFSQKAELAFALGKASDDICDFKKAYHFYEEGNKLKRKNINFSLEKEKIEFNEIKKNFDKGTFNKFQLKLKTETTPIFILGMPRSGTTLIEQILSSHPKVFGGDELNFLPELINKYFLNKNKIDYIKKINPNVLQSMGNEYIDSLKKLSKNSVYVTDKLPINFKWIGLIKIILPNSKIIHCVRNPKDVCLSVFKNYFVNPKLNFAYDLDEICEFYKLYNDLMNYWNKVIPKFIYNVKYEELIKSPKKVIENMLNSCNLNWSEKCYKFYNNTRPIKTASDTQVRKKLYKSSINSWKKYKNYLSKNFIQLV